MRERLAPKLVGPRRLQRQRRRLRIDVLQSPGSRRDLGQAKPRNEDIWRLLQEVLPCVFKLERRMGQMCEGVRGGRSSLPLRADRTSLFKHDQHIQRGPGRPEDGGGVSRRRTVREDVRNCLGTGHRLAAIHCLYPRCFFSDAISAMDTPAVVIRLGYAGHVCRHLAESRSGCLQAELHDCHDR